MRAVFSSLRVLKAVGLLGLLMCVSSRAQAQQVTVELTSGRTFTAAMDERTDADHLWLRFEAAGASLLRPVEWNAVEAAWIDEEPIAVVDLQASVAELATTTNIQWQPALEEVPAVGGPTYAELAEVALAPAPPIRSVDFEACLVNWDGDVEMDGLELHLYPIDRLGHLAAVSGTVEVELIAARYLAFDARPHGQGRAIVPIARWSQAVRIEDFGPGGAVLQLPFQAIHPEFNTDTAPRGLVHVRLMVPGEGTFEASHDPVRIRPFSPVRDNLQRVEHRRFFPSENAGRGLRHTD